MKKELLLGSVLFSSLAFAQVGINTPTPTSTLDITAKNATGNATNVDGLLIPRVDRLRAQSMTGVPASTLVYINNVSNGTQTGTTINVDTVGHYFYNGTAWMKLNTSGGAPLATNIYTSDGTLNGNRLVTQGANTLAFSGYSGVATNAFSVDGTTLSVDAVNDRVGIGAAAPTAKLDMVGTTFGIKNSETVGSWDNLWFNVGPSIPSINASGAESGLQFNVGSNAVGTYGDGQTLATVATMLSTGNMGVGTTTPGTKLDVDGAITNRETSVVIASNAATVPANVSQIQLIGAATAVVAITAPAAPNAGQRLIIYNNTTGGFGATLNTINIPNGRALEFVYSNAGWRSTDGGAAAAVTSPVNIYTSNGTIGSNRIVTQGANTLAFTSTATNGFSVDGSTFSVDAPNNRVGIGTAAPTARLEISSGQLDVSGLKFSNISNATPSTGNTAALGVDANGNVVVQSSLSTSFKSFSVDANVPANSLVTIGTLQFRYPTTTCTSTPSFIQVRSSGAGNNVGILHAMYRTAQSGATFVSTVPLTATTTFSDIASLPIDCVQDGNVQFSFFSYTDRTFYRVSVNIADGDSLGFGALGYIFVEFQE